MELMRLRFVLPVVMIGAGLLLPVQTPALAKTSYQQHKFKKYKVGKFKGTKFKGAKKYKGPMVGKQKAPKHERA